MTSMPPKFATFALVSAFFLVTAFRPLARAQVIIPPTPANQLSVGVTTSVTYDSASGLYTYSYALNNASASQQAAWLFALQLNGKLTGSPSPSGWTSVEHDDQPLLSWAATDVGTLPPDYVDNGNLPPSPFTIAPGATLSGFQLISPDPPGNVAFLRKATRSLLK